MLLALFFLVVSQMQTDIFHRAQPALIFSQYHTQTQKTEDCMHPVNYGWKGKISWERQSEP